MARRRGALARVFVTIPGNLKYGFRTNIALTTEHGTALGQTIYANQAGVFFGANAPKPPRASLETATGTVGSFCSSDKISTLKAAGWIVTRNRSIRGVKTAGRTRTVYVDMPGGYKYAWNITAAEVDLAATLGFTAASGGDASTLIWGINSPKPPRASKKENGSSVSTFCKPQQSVIDAAITAGFTITGVDYDLLPNS